MTDYLLDNDVVLKLAQYDLLEQLQELCGGPERLFVLPTLRFRFHLKDDAKALTIVGTTEALERIREFIGAISELESTNEEFINALQNAPQIDAGEAVLFAAALENENRLTYTGDKRAVEALLSSRAMAQLVEPLLGRIKCLEQVVAEILIGFDEKMIVAKIQGKTWDSALRASFASGDPKESLAGLRSYYNALNKKCGDSLASFPEPI